MKRVIFFVLLSLSVLICVEAILIATDPLRKSNEEVRKYVLGLTPIGTSKEDVIQFIKENQDSFKRYKRFEHYDVYEHYDYGFIIKSDRAVMLHQGYSYDDSEMIGNETIVATIGQYPNPFDVIVFAYWAFDEQGKLIDVGISKGSNSM